MKIKLAGTYAKVSTSELSRRIGVTPQAFNQRMRTGKFSTEELTKIGEALGAEFVYGFRFPDGTDI